ncbi:uncharacterized protein L203_106269 [Cryptococcus depauperatus CBS 7841]|uniref:Peptidyl-prolyl isomerase CWC27 n=1 Tax=Cryptococcus depauperatus CBS 7841 TaxID=1295531 RepID=A0AAJ8M4T5_9TREE
MSNLYATEPATNGKVIIETTAGEIEVELWGKETPKAVRNFIGLALEGYYEGVIFHRIVPKFIVQTGDPSGTGMGGESFYGEPFGDEIHGRLKFNRRGLLGMANNEARNTNTSQFFITLDAAPELTSKHTLFGKVVGNTIYNVLNIGNLEIDKEERPLVPPKIRDIRIIENPFDDIVPRITASERRAQQAAKLEAKKEIEKKEKRAKAKKNTGLLSFGEAEEVQEEAVSKKSMTRQDLIEAEPPMPKAKPVSYIETPESLKDIGRKSFTERKGEIKVTDLKDVRAQHEAQKAGSSVARQAVIKQMEEDLRRLKRRDSASSSESDSRRPKGPSYLEEELAKYASSRGRAAVRAGKKRGRNDEDDLLKEMRNFTKKITDAGDSEPEDELNDRNREMDEMEKTQKERSEYDEGDALDIDDDVGWMRHRLKFEVDERDLTRRAEDEYAVIDPRAKARDLDRTNSRRKEKEIKKSYRAVRDVGKAY